MEISSVSKRYAGALYDVAVEENARDAVRADCKAIAELFDGTSEFANFVENPTIVPQVAEKTIDALFSGKAHSATLRFLNFLISKRRLDQLRAVCEVYELQVSEELGSLKVTITAAHELSDAQVAKMKEKLQTRYNKQIDENVKIDASLIGGFKIQVGDHISDFSIATQLDQFEQSVINA